MNSNFTSFLINNHDCSWVRRCTTWANNSSSSIGVERLSSWQNCDFMAPLDRKAVRRAIVPKSAVLIEVSKIGNCGHESGCIVSLGKKMLYHCTITFKRTRVSLHRKIRSTHGLAPIVTNLIDIGEKPLIVLIPQMRLWMTSVIKELEYIRAKC